MNNLIVYRDNIIEIDIVFQSKVFVIYVFLYAIRSESRKTENVASLYNKVHDKPWYSKFKFLNYF